MIELHRCGGYYSSMPFRIEIEINGDGEALANFTSLKLTAKIYSQEFDALTDALEYVLGPNGFRKDMKALQGRAWTFRWFEVLPDNRGRRQLEDCRFFFGDMPIPDGCLHSDSGPFLLDREIDPTVQEILDEPIAQTKLA